MKNCKYSMGTLWLERNLELSFSTYNHAHNLELLHSMVQLCLPLHQQILSFHSCIHSSILHRELLHDSVLVSPMCLLRFDVHFPFRDDCSCNRRVIRSRTFLHHHESSTEKVLQQHFACFPEQDILGMRVDDGGNLQRGTSQPDCSNIDHPCSLQVT
jgi:hypothetical protein